MDPLTPAAGRDQGNRGREGGTGTDREKYFLFRQIKVFWRDEDFFKLVFLLHLAMHGGRAGDYCSFTSKSGFAMVDDELFATSWCVGRRSFQKAREI